MRTALSDVEAFTVAQADSAATQAEALANAGRSLLIMVTLAVIAPLAPGRLTLTAVNAAHRQRCHRIPSTHPTLR